MIYIYTLSHPITNEVRYVGKTINIKRRYKQHLYDKRNTHKCNWVQSLRKDKLKPILTIIEECESNWQDREKYWITQYDNLTNFSDGGGSDYMRVTSEETKEKIRQANLGKAKSDEHKQKIGATNKGKINPRRKQISCEGIVFDSIIEAAKHFKVYDTTIADRVKSNNEKFNNYFYL
ncbi:GIY-YIG nuclease family protein [Flavobacterium sp.]|uniref:GIY-YIG nuclease family protein n=1 Tax=Flavobacterium sp. TaxID=239 RepID=UPI0026110C11|nr:GIY-YIG nuclease family protein [Flavobacterium sp.]